MKTINIDNNNTDVLKIIYLLYFAGIFGMLTSFIGIIAVYAKKFQAEDWIKTHYIFLEHTFWKGLVIFLFGAILKVILVGYLIWAFLLVWWLARCIKGIQALSRREAIDDPYSWVF